MIGIYKITSPSGRIYIGQSVNIDNRISSYKNLKCKNQTKLYRSLLKYTFENHTFEVIEECSVEILNERERHWQDFYNSGSKKGLNCKLTKTESKSGHYSEEARKRISASITAFYQTPEGRESKARGVANTDWAARTANFNYVAKSANTNYVARTANTDYTARTANTDYTKINYTARTANTDYVARTANTDYEAKAKKYMKPIVQYERDGTFIKEWSSAKEAGESLQIRSSDITACCKGRQKSSGKFVWKYSEIKL